MAKAGEIEGLEPGLPFREAAARSLEVRAAEMFGHADGVLDTNDIDRVHDMRVASRRLRAVMEIFAPCFPAREYKLALREVKAIADALGERRDPDVAVRNLERLARGFGSPERPGLEGLADDFRAEQAAGNERLALALERVEQAHLRARLEVLAAEARGFLRSA
jgi:CHAD domain-containing protein